MLVVVGFRRGSVVLVGAYMRVGAQAGNRRGRVGCLPAIWVVAGV